MSREGFRPAGHRAQELSDIVLPDETFKPIQRVVKRPNFFERLFGRKEQTVGYLYRDVEYRKGCVGDVVLSAGLLRDKRGNVRYNAKSAWQAYEHDEKENPIEWRIPSGPTTIEMIYRTQRDSGPIQQEVDKTWYMTPLHMWPITSTIITYTPAMTYVEHDWNEPLITTSTPEERPVTITIADNNTPDTQQFLQAILGKRHALTQKILGRYAPVKLTTRTDGMCFLGFGSDKYYGRFYIDTVDLTNKRQSARGISLLENFPSPQYEVRDD